MESTSAKKEERQPAPYQVLPPSYPYPPYYYPVEEEEVNLLDYWRVLWKRKWSILFVTLVMTGLAIVLSLYFPKKYKSTATLMPLTSSGSGGLSNIASQLSSIPMVGSQLGSLGSLGGGKTKELVNILKSRILSEKVIQKFDLMKVFFAKRYDPQTNTYRPNWMGVAPIFEDAVDVFQKKVTNVEEDKKTGLIKIEVKLKDPVLAAKIANEMVLDLQDFINNNSLTISKRNRIFIEGQLVKNGAKLLEAGKELNNFYAQNRISSVVPQLDVNVGSYETVPDPLQNFQDQLAALDKQQKEVERKKEESRVSNVPGQIYLQYLTLNRELITKSHALLTQQYELAKIDEAKEDLAFQVIDKASVMVRPYFPLLTLNVAVGLAGGFFLAVFFAFFREYIEKLKAKEAEK